MLCAQSEPHNILRDRYFDVTDLLPTCYEQSPAVLIMPVGSVARVVHSNSIIVTKTIDLVMRNARAEAGC